jgi:hypothetical protein
VSVLPFAFAFGRRTRLWLRDYLFLERKSSATSDYIVCYNMQNIGYRLVVIGFLLWIELLQPGSLWWDKVKWNEI